MFWLKSKLVAPDLRFCFKPADIIFFRQLINWQGKTKRLQSNKGINEHWKHRIFPSVFFRPLLQDLILGLRGFDLLDVAPLDLSAAFFVGFSIVLARTNNQAICGNLSLGHSLYMQTAMSSYWTTNLTKGSAWYMPWVFWFGTGAVRMFCGSVFFFAPPASRCVSCVCENRCIHVSTFDSSHLVSVPHLTCKVSRAGGECVCSAGNIAWTCKHWWHAADPVDLRFVRVRDHPLLHTFGWQVPIHLGIRTVCKQTWFFNALC